MKFCIRYNVKSGGGTTETTVEANSQHQAKQIFQMMLPGAQVIEATEVRECRTSDSWSWKPIPTPANSPPTTNPIDPLVTAAAVAGAAALISTREAVYVEHQPQREISDELGRE